MCSDIIFVYLWQGEAHGAEVINVLEATRRVMNELCSQPNLTRFVERVRQLRDTDCKNLTLVKNNLSQIEQWFSGNVSDTYGDVIGKLNGIVRDGKATFPVTATGVGMHLEFPMLRQGKDVIGTLDYHELEVVYVSII